MKHIDVFIDLEGLGVGSPERSKGGRLKELLRRLPPILTQEGYAIREIWGTASVWRRRMRLSGDQQILFNRALKKHHGTLVWTMDEADRSLIQEVERRLQAETLSEAVLLIASDHDFGPLVKRLAESGRFVIVSGHEVSKRLAGVAHKVLRISDIFEDGKGVTYESPPALRNPIQLP